jgi:hypothetical protein
LDCRSPDHFILPARLHDLLVALGHRRFGGGQIVFLLGGLGPLISALVITRLSGRRVREWLRSLLVWRVSPGYYAIALLLPAAIYAVINGVLFALGQRLNFCISPRSVGSKATVSATP